MTNSNQDELPLSFAAKGRTAVPASTGFHRNRTQSCQIVPQIFLIAQSSHQKSYPVGFRVYR